MAALPPRPVAAAARATETERKRLCVRERERDRKRSVTMEGGKAAEIKERVAAERAASRVAAGLRLGARVEVDRDGTTSVGVVRYKGTTKFAMGIWLGIELDSDDGKHDGTVGTTRYFVCPPNKGIFVRPTQVTPLGEVATAAATTGSTESTAENSSNATPAAPSMPIVHCNMLGCNVRCRSLCVVCAS